MSSIGPIQSTVKSPTERDGIVRNQPDDAGYGFAQLLAVTAAPTPPRPTPAAERDGSEMEASNGTRAPAGEGASRRQNDGTGETSPATATATTGEGGEVAEPSEGRVVSETQACGTAATGGSGTVATETAQQSASSSGSELASVEELQAELDRCGARILDEPRSGTGAPPDLAQVVGRQARGLGPILRFILGERGETPSAVASPAAEARGPSGTDAAGDTAPAARPIPVIRAEALFDRLAQVAGTKGFEWASSGDVDPPARVSPPPGQQGAATVGATISRTIPSLMEAVRTLVRAVATIATPQPEADGDASPNAPSSTPSPLPAEAVSAGQEVVDRMSRNPSPAGVGPLPRGLAVATAAEGGSILRSVTSSPSPETTPVPRGMPPVAEGSSTPAPLLSANDRAASSLSGEQTWRGFARALAARGVTAIDPAGATAEGDGSSRAAGATPSVEGQAQQGRDRGESNPHASGRAASRQTGTTAEPASDRSQSFRMPEGALLDAPVAGAKGNGTAGSTLSPARAGGTQSLPETAFERPPATTSGITIRFDPQNGLAGQVRVTVRGDEVRAVFVADDRGTAQRLADSVTGLQQMLRDRGFTEARVVVQSPAQAETASSGERRADDPSWDRSDRERRTLQDQNQSDARGGRRSNRDDRDRREER
jgi:hypothetical protein